MATADSEDPGSGRPLIACELDSAGFARQTGRWRALLRSNGIAATPTDDGIRVLFDDAPGVPGKLRALAEAENGCCSWAQWEVLEEQGRLVMRATAGGDGIAVLHQLLELIGEAVPKADDE